MKERKNVRVSLLSDVSHDLLEIGARDKILRHGDARFKVDDGMPPTAWNKNELSLLTYAFERPLLQLGLGSGPSFERPLHYDEIRQVRVRSRVRVRVSSPLLVGPSHCYSTGGTIRLERQELSPQLHPQWLLSQAGPVPG